VRATKIVCVCKRKWNTYRNITSMDIRNVKCAQKENTYQTANQKCVLSTENEQFPDSTSEMLTVHRNRTLLRRYTRNVYCAPKRKTFVTLKRNVYCAQKQNTFQTVLQKCEQCAETEHFPDGRSEMCTVQRNRTYPRRYFINVFCTQKQNTFQNVYQ
jgi:hypothetical protein